MVCSLDNQVFYTGRLRRRRLSEMIDVKHGMDYHIQPLIDHGTVQPYPQRRMRFGTLDIEPRRNPAVLDTATWEPASAWHGVSAMDESYFLSVSKAIKEGHPLPQDRRCIVYASSCAEYREKIFSLVELVDGQHVFLEIGTDTADGPLAEPIGIRFLSNGIRLAAYRADTAAIDRFVSLIRLDKSPKALGAVPRLGIGSRMSTAAWPGVWRAMKRYTFQANPIQNSVREVNVLQDILAGQPARFNYLANFGRVEEGHTGSTFQGLWVAGVLEALKTDFSCEYGADADHITVRRAADNIAHAKLVIEAARLYTFFTLDVSDLLDYDAMSVSPHKSAQEYLTNCIPQWKQQTEVLAYHTQRHSVGSQYQMSKATAERLIGKYWLALDAVEQLSNHIATMKKGIPFDLELSIDETPSGVDAFTCLTSEIELVFFLRELRRRRIPLTHIAPNLGIEKGLDYRGSDGLQGLKKRIQGLYRCVSEFGVLLDCHSGDDLRSETRKVVGRATQGNVHFKISPALQVIFAEVLNEFDPDLFRFWWDDTLDYARREAAAGSDFAAQCLHQYEMVADSPQSPLRRAPSPSHAVFHYYNFATVGRRDQTGQFVYRQKFYELPEGFYKLYRDRVAIYLGEVANDVFGGTS